MTARGSICSALAIVALAASSYGVNAMMPPSVYDEAIEEAAGRAILGALSVELYADALLCAVRGTVMRTVVGIGDFPRFDDSRPIPVVPDPDGRLDRPEVGQQMTVAVPCISDDTKDVPVGGDIYQRYEKLLEAAEVTILIDSGGGFHEAHSAGFRITSMKTGN